MNPCRADFLACFGAVLLLLSPAPMAAQPDFNGDGKADILWRNYATGENSIWLMNGTSPTAFLLIRKADDVNWQLAGSGDFNGDGSP